MSPGARRLVRNEGSQKATALFSHGENPDLGHTKRNHQTHEWGRLFFWILCVALFGRAIGEIEELYIYISYSILYSVLVLVT